VVRQGALVGIVTRANLLQALTVTDTANAGSSDDRSIRDRLVRKLEGQPWANPGMKNVLVQDGVVHLWGFVRSDDERQAIRVAAENVGALAVQDHLREYQAPIGAAWS
jgi:osmotically-inducible protein OsmY